MAQLPVARRPEDEERLVDFQARSTPIFRRWIQFADISLRRLGPESSLVGVPKHALVNGDVAGDITVTGIKLGDRLDEVIEYVYVAMVTTDILDLTGEFTITGDDTIDNTGGSNTSGNKLLVRWTKLTA